LWQFLRSPNLDGALERRRSADRSPAVTSPFVFALYPDLTQLDFTGPFEVFQRLPGARIQVASREGGPLRADSGLLFAELAQLSEISDCDLICIPGGYGLTAALRDAEYLRQVRRLGSSARYITSVCTGSLVLAAAGLLEGKRATCQSIQLAIEYDPQPPFASGSPESAPPAVLERVRASSLRLLDERRAALRAAIAARTSR
jgi:cyclohexyl-isocyanide hydratase